MKTWIQIVSCSLSNTLLPERATQLVDSCHVGRVLGVLIMISISVPTCAPRSCIIGGLPAAAMQLVDWCHVGVLRAHTSPRWSTIIYTHTSVL